MVAELSRDGRYLGLYIGHGWGKKTEVYVKDLAEQTAPSRPIVNDIDAEFTPEFAGDRMFAKTNWKAPNGRIFAIDLAKPARANWREVVPESKSVIAELFRHRRAARCELSGEREFAREDSRRVGKSTLRNIRFPRWVP